MSRSILSVSPFILTALLALAACGEAPSSAPTIPSAPAVADTASPSSAPLTTTPPSVVASPSAASSPSAPAPSSSLAAASSGAQAQASGVKLTLMPDGSKVDIKMRELLAGNAAQTEAVESSTAVTGSILLDAQGGVLPGSKITLDLRTLKSDRDIRDNFMKRVTLQTNNFPTMDFVPKQVQGLNGGVPASGQLSFKLLGDATVRGVTHSMTWDVTATFGDQAVKGQATSAFKLSDFGLTPPKAGPVISVDDAGNLVVSFQAGRSAP